MKKLIFVFVAFMVMAGTCGCKKEPKLVDIYPPREYDFSSEDSFLMVSLFEDYLDRANERALEVAKTIDSLDRGNEPSTASLANKKNKIHVDSVMHACISLVKWHQYEAMLNLLEKEQKNIYQYPGNIVENELPLVWMVSLLLEQRYADNKEYAYNREVAWYENVVLHMETLQALTGEECEQYEQALRELGDIYLMINWEKKYKEVIKKLENMGRLNEEE